MKERDVKLTPSAYMHYMEKGWLNPNPHKYSIQCIDGDVKLPYTRVHIKKRGQAPQYVKYTQHESLYRGDLKLPLHIGNTYQTNFENNFDTTLK